jgi:hypothetical protein
MQETSLQWMVNNYRGEVRNGKWWPRNCILGDEVRRLLQQGRWQHVATTWYLVILFGCAA